MFLIGFDFGFTIFVSAIRQGRIIFENIRKVLLYLLSDSFSEIILIAGALLIGLPLPILPAQILWINLVNDGLPSLALTFEKGEEGIMLEKPRSKEEPVLNRELKFLIFIIGVFVNIAIFILFFWLLKIDMDIDRIRTIIFTVLAIDSLIYVFSCRSLRHSIFNSNIFKNKLLIGSVFIGFTMQILAIYLPPLQKVFRTVPLNLRDWIMTLAFSLLGVLLIEISKHFFIVKRSGKSTLKAS